MACSYCRLACYIVYQTWWVLQLGKGGKGVCIKYVDGNMCERTVIKSLESRLRAFVGRQRRCFDLSLAGVAGTTGEGFLSAVPPPCLPCSCPAVTNAHFGAFFMAEVYLKSNQKHGTYSQYSPTVPVSCCLDWSCSCSCSGCAPDTPAWAAACATKYKRKRHLKRFN